MYTLQDEIFSSDVNLKLEWVFSYAHICPESLGLKKLQAILHRTIQCGTVTCMSL